MMHYVLFSSLFIFLILFSGCTIHPAPLMHKAACEEGIYSLKSARCLDRKSLLEKLEPYPVIFVGDHHTSRKVHEFTADLIKGLDEKGYTVHLASEWFTPEDDNLLALYAKEMLDDGNFTDKFDWKKKITYDFSLFAPIYHAVQENEGFLYGINLSRAERKRISRENLEEMSETQKAFFESLDTNVSAHRQMLLPFFSHCHGMKKGESKTECSERMYRVQVAWDTMMGKNSAMLAQRVLAGPDEKLIVFAGAMHMYNSLGANMRFARFSNLPSVTILPETVSEDGYFHGEADYLYLYKKENEEKK